MIASLTRTTDTASYTPKQPAAQTFPLDSGQTRNTIQIEVEDLPNLGRLLENITITSAGGPNTDTSFRELEAICMVDTSSFFSTHIDCQQRTESHSNTSSYSETIHTRDTRIDFSLSTLP